MVTNNSDDNSGVLEPSSSLHTKLQAIIAAENRHSDETHRYDMDGLIAQILQAFKSEGYVKLEDNVEVKDNVIRIKDLNLMTGQVFLDRFKAELDNSRWMKTGGDLLYGDVLEAARRAARVSE